MAPKKDDTEFNQNEQTKIFVKQLTDLIQAGKSGTMKDIAEKLDYNYSALSQIVNGRRNVPPNVYSKFTEMYKTGDVMEWKDEKIALLQEMNDLLKEQLRKQEDTKKALEEGLDEVKSQMAASLDKVLYQIKINQAYAKALWLVILHHRIKQEKADSVKIQEDMDRILVAELKAIS